jgi:hypothetical protein
MAVSTGAYQPTIAAKVNPGVSVIATRSGPLSSAMNWTVPPAAILPRDAA